MPTAVVIDDESSLTVEAYCINQPNKSRCHCISHYFHFNIPFERMYASNTMECFSNTSGCSVCKSTCIKAFKGRAGLGYRLMASGYC